MDDLPKLVRELKDRQDIYDCLMRYCHGIDRLDREMLESVYHPDAVDDHGGYGGPASGFIDWALDLHIKNQHRTHHSISNHYCELDGDVAHVETYWAFSAVNKAPPHHTQLTGRYVDRFERRDGRWAIAARVCLVDTTNEVIDPEGKLGDMRNMPTARNRSDPSYMRPLVIDPRRLVGERPSLQGISAAHLHRIN